MKKYILNLEHQFYEYTWLWLILGLIGLCLLFHAWKKLNELEDEL